MKHLPDPVGEVLEQDADERRLRRNWEATRARLDGARRGPRFVLVGAAAVAAVVLLWPRVSTLWSPRAEGPITVEGAAPVPVEAVATPRVLRFDDASTIELAPGTAIAPTRNEATRFDLALASGRARFEVTPGGPREWTIDAGLARVRVLGTAFVVERQDTHVRVAVEHGHVRVEGALVRGGRRDLRDGESLVVERAPEVATRAVEETDEVAQVEVPEVVEPPGRATRDERTRWRELAERGEHDAAFAVLSGPGVAQRSEEASPRELLLLADVARLSGHPDDAVAPLTRLIERHRTHAEAPLAAITLARIHGSRARPADALR
ncbi:MAG: FecR domain-containing protein, partial [Myxococcales bacterium]|nr:FecR domain-containing protein [Myxococcales bacterium]